MEPGKTVESPLAPSWYVKIIKCFISRDKRKGSITRQLVFDIIRCELNGMIFPFIAGGFESFTKDDFALVKAIAWNMVLVSCISLTINLIVNPIWYTRKPLLWRMLMMEHQCIRGTNMLKIYNNIE